MDIFDVLLQAGLITVGIVVYLLFRRTVPKFGNYKQAGWNYSFKYIFARFAVRGWKSEIKPTPVSEEPRADQLDGWDALTVRATAPDGSAVLASVRKLCARQPLAEAVVHVKLPDGTTYVLPKKPEASVGAWESTPGAWSVNGLKIQILEPGHRWRVIYNGLLTRVQDNATQHVKFNLIWVSVAKPIRHPEDWSNQLAAQALALEPWKDSKWSRMLGKWKDGSWVQFGSMQGRFQSFDDQGLLDQDVYLRTRGLRERSWAPSGYQGLRRSVYLTAATSDGTVVQLKCLSYRNVLTEVKSGSVRFPNFAAEPITGADLIMSDFCETPQQVPSAYTINVSTSFRDLKLLARFHKDGARYFSGVPFQYDLTLITFGANIDGYSGTGICELGYETTVSKEPSNITRAPPLKWVTSKQTDVLNYCVTLEEREAACPDYVGGKGASLALLASIQKEEGYRVPPGFCLTIRALDKHLEQNPEIIAAIKEIEVANVNYDESNFKSKCEKASSLFASTEITGDVKKEILSNMTYLRKKALEENLGPELRFAVRSSAVGEDSEVLSAAGQNETILGCETDDDIILGVQKCWGSMFAFTSAYYRRQNGQECRCGGGVVVQALAKARVAGVLFTRHPALGDSRRLLLTANYGLGESVVSGAVEPDTFIIKRSIDSTPLTISEVTLGTKKQRVSVQGSSVTFEDVPIEERSAACLTNEEVLKLAQLGVVQDELWAAGRDIEWAFVGSEIFLLQARPITALERWSEEELLHEMDCAIMSDDELISFGNTGEVMPRTVSVLTNDMAMTPLSIGMDKIVTRPPSSMATSAAIINHRLVLSLYNSLYRLVPKEIDVSIRMIEMSIHGHAVANDEIQATAHHRNPPKWYHFLDGIKIMGSALLKSKSCMKAAIKLANSLTIKADKEDDPISLLQALFKVRDVVETVSMYHSISTVGSSSSQLIAMNVLMEGRKEFSPEICNEISTLLGSGSDVLSAEVPNSLAKLARMLEASGHYDQFRALDPKDAMNWLKKSLPQIYLEVCAFLEKHGFRAIMEFDLVTKPWVLRPEDMMKVLQNLRASPEDKAKSKTDAEIVASLKTPQKPITRKILRWVMPLCRRTVSHRECTKAHLILTIHKMRLAFIQLGKMLVKRWYLPHEDLVFHFRANELQAFIETRDPGLLRKAIQRQQCQPKWCKQKFAELNKGWLIPLPEVVPTITAGDVKITAAAVCGGEVVARACVVKDLSEIDQLQQGDILITHATDIGWSPYFPILSGIVTELGGLISHGAVIAREYGLPCLVGAAGATDIFRTGDLVRLSATHATLERVSIQTDNKCYCSGS